MKAWNLLKLGHHNLIWNLRASVDEVTLSRVLFSPPRMSHIYPVSEEGLGPMGIQNPIPKLLPYCELNVIKMSIALV